MGLTIYYRMKAKVGADDARGLVRRLHRFVSTLPFDDVSAVEEYDPPGGDYVFARGRAPAGWKPGARYLDRWRDDGLTESVQVPALHVICFRANLRGSETASFGLACHQPVVLHREDVVTRRHDGEEDRALGAGPAVEFPTRLRGWYSWSNFCKTQYAANPKHGGDGNFLRGHLSVFQAVDECKRLGMSTWIRDDAKYWKHRDEAKLLAELHKWDELIAGFTGRLGDALGDVPGAIVAPIKERPDFEHLEAKGDDRLAGRAGRRRPARRRQPRKGGGPS